MGAFKSTDDSVSIKPKVLGIIANVAFGKGDRHSLIDFIVLNTIYRIDLHENFIRNILLA